MLLPFLFFHSSFFSLCFHVWPSIFYIRERFGVRQTALGCRPRLTYYYGHSCNCGWKIDEEHTLIPFPPPLPSQSPIIIRPIVVAATLFLHLFPPSFKPEVFPVDPYEDHQLMKSWSTSKLHIEPNEKWRSQKLDGPNTVSPQVPVSYTHLTLPTILRV